METIEVKKQRQMTFGETFEFCLSSIKHRIGRSLLTSAVVILAVAFFMYLQSANIFRNSVKSGVEQEILESRKPSKLMAILYSHYSRNDFESLLAGSRKNAHDVARFSKVLGLPVDVTQKLAGDAFTELYYNRFFTDMPIGKRKDLFGGRTPGREILTYLQTPENFADMQKKMLEIGGMRIPGGAANFQKFLGTYSEYMNLLDRSFEKFQRFQQSLLTKDIPQNDSALLRKYLIKLSEDPAKLQAWRQHIAEGGFELTDAELDSIIRYQKMTDNIEKVSTLLYHPDYRKKWRIAYGQNKYIRMDEKLAILDKPKTLDILRGAEYDGKEAVAEEQLIEIAREYRSRQNLKDLELYLEIDIFKESAGFTVSQIYLMALSFLVCVVGITNAMLMSITERFREIATLKCLGATDSFILIQIVLEALIQGVIGSLIGILLGFLVALTASCMQVGFRVFHTFDFTMIGMSVLISLVVGMLLSVLASLYPSYRAARMAPMEAMRVE